MPAQGMSFSYSGDDVPYCTFFHFVVDKLGYIRQNK